MKRWSIIEVNYLLASPVEDSLQKGVLRSDKTAPRHISNFSSSLLCSKYLLHKTNMQRGLLSMSVKKYAWD